MESLVEHKKEPDIYNHDSLLVIFVFCSKTTEKSDDHISQSGYNYNSSGFDEYRCDFFVVGQWFWCSVNFFPVGSSWVAPGSLQVCPSWQNFHHQLPRSLQDPFSTQFTYLLCGQRRIYRTQTQKSHQDMRPHVVLIAFIWKYEHKTCLFFKTSLK